jgi:hypothetical protein
LRPAPRAAAITSRYGSQALAWGHRPGRGGHGGVAESVDTPLAGFAADRSRESVDVSLAEYEVAGASRVHPVWSALGG